MHKKTKIEMSNQRLGVNQLLEVTPNRLLTKNFLRFSSRASCVHDEKRYFLNSFSNVFDRFRPCKRMHKQALAGRIHNSKLHWVIGTINIGLVMVSILMEGLLFGPDLKVSLPWCRKLLQIDLYIV